MTPVHGETGLHGQVARGFEPVREAFARNFADHGELGAAVAVYVDGEKKADLWGGVADAATGRPWARDTLVLVFSVTKGATGVLCALLAEQGRLDLDAPVARYWPEFAVNGKADVTVRHVLSHTAGLPVMEADLTVEELIDGRPAAAALAAQRPLWEPGTRHGYHGLTYGWLTGEIVRRATGQTVGELFAAEVAAPLGLDFHIGLPERSAARLAPLIDPPVADPAAVETAIAALPDPEARAVARDIIAAMSDPASLMYRMAMCNGTLPTPAALLWNRRDLHAAEQPAANGVTDACSLARMYAACVGEVDGTRLLSAAALAAATREQAAGTDQVMPFRNRFATGFTLPSPSLRLLSGHSFGQLGASGALGFGDSAHRVGLGYVTNLIGGAPEGDPRPAALVSALREVLKA
jgi:CubicO group peptidase (beta-lactamase class C family)